MSNSDLRLVAPVSNANRGIRTDGSDSNITQNELQVRASTARRVSTADARLDGTRVNDNYAASASQAWTKFMADMLGALDIALSAQDAAADGTIDTGEWNDIFSKASKDGEVSLLEISAMYAGLQDMHDKGALSDSEYKEGVGALERELSARYSGGSSNGLDQLARLYINTLDTNSNVAVDDTVVQRTRIHNRRDVDLQLDNTLGSIGIRRPANGDVNGGSL